MSKKLQKPEQPNDGVSDADLAAWLEDAPPPTGCHTCRHGDGKGAAATLRKIMHAMLKRGSHNITLRKLHTKLQEIHPDYQTKYWGFRDHLYVCEKELYEATKKVRTHA